MITIPPKGKRAEEILAAMSRLREHDANWQEGRTWSLVYHANDKVTEIVKEAYAMFFSENYLDPGAFPSLRKLEAEVLAMTASLLGGDNETVGNMTSGGTESILLAVKAAREWARLANRADMAPEMILPATAHPAFQKAARFLSVKPVYIPVGSDFRADVAAASAAITPNTVLMVGSAPTYPHGVTDPITELAHVAQENEILFHVDACVGGFLLPFVRKLGHTVPDFDLSVPGVTSISADLHKYAYSAKGASIILYRNKALRRHQFTVYADWPGGIFASPTMMGTKPGGPIAAAWAIMNYLGDEGYLAIADAVMNTTQKLRDGINTIEGINVLGNPVMSIIAFGSDTLNIYAVGDEMAHNEWYLSRQQEPPSLHLTVTQVHAQIVDQFLDDLGKAVTKVKGSGSATPANIPAAMYGMTGSLSNEIDLEELALVSLDQMTCLEGESGAEAQNAR